MSCKDTRRHRRSFVPNAPRISGQSDTKERR